MASPTWEPDEAAAAVAEWLSTARDKRYIAYFHASQADKASLPTVNVLNRLFCGWRGARAAAEALHGHTPRA